MNSSRIKNFVIIVLLAAAVYQTGKLWLGDVAGHNFFYTVISAFDQDRPTQRSEGNILLPGRFAIGKANQFSLYYPDVQGSDAIMEACSDLITETINQGTSNEQIIKPDWKKIQSSRCIIFQYDFLIPLEVYLDSWGKSAALKQMTHIDSIAILPSKTNSEVAAIYFINSKTDQSISVSNKQSRYGSTLYKMIDAMPEGLNYASTAQSGFKLFQGNVFVPQGRLTYPLLEQDMPFENDGVISRTLLENSVDGFFKNFAADWTTKDTSGIYSFSDENVVVKYYPEGLLEYYSYEAYDEERIQGLLEGYKVCRNFLNSDKSLQTDVYLSHLSIRSDEIIYYFDYHVNNFPIVFSEDLRRKIASEHAIEIIVRDNSVRKYRRYACNFTADTQNSAELTTDFLSALNDAILEYQQEEDSNVVTEVTDMYLAYLADVSADIKLKWFTELYGMKFMHETGS